MTGDAVELLVDVTFGSTASRSAGLISCRVSSVDSESLESVPSPELVEPPRDAWKDVGEYEKLVLSKDLKVLQKVLKFKFSRIYFESL